MNTQHIIKRPLVTEKSSLMKEASNAYVFEVVKSADKTSIKRAVEQLFQVKVKSVHTLVQRGKIKRFASSMGRTKAWKKAIVTLAKDQKIQLFEGV